MKPLGQVLRIGTPQPWNDERLQPSALLGTGQPHQCVSDLRMLADTTLDTPRKHIDPTDLHRAVAPPQHMEAVVIDPLDLIRQLGRHRLANRSGRAIAVRTRASCDHCGNSRKGASGALRSPMPAVSEAP